MGDVRLADAERLLCILLRNVFSFFSVRLLFEDCVFLLGVGFLALEHGVVIEVECSWALEGASDLVDLLEYAVIAPLE